MKLPLTHDWLGRPLPEGIGGEASVQIAGPTLRWSWEVTLPQPLRVPRSAPGFLDGLWDHDVVELFLMRGDAHELPRTTHYLELEAGPGGHWLAIAFDGVRRRASLVRELPPPRFNEVSGGTWRGSWSLPVPSVEEWLLRSGPWRGLACLATSRAGERVHAAHAPLPGIRADFHQPAEWPELQISP